MRLLLLVITSLFLTGCAQRLKHQPSEKEKLTNNILKKVSHKLKKENGLQPCGTGGQMMDEIVMLHLAFNYYLPVDVEQGRKLLITAVNEFLAEVNSDEKVRPYLKNYPFMPHNIQIVIFIQNPDGSDVAPEQLRVISAMRGLLAYEINSPTGFFITVHAERYEEALLQLSSQDFKQSV